MADVGLAPDIEQLKQTPEYARLTGQYLNREWRLDNIYRIIDEKGEAVKFKRNAAQRAYMGAMWSRDLIPKARQLGFSTLIELLIADTCIFRSNITAGIVDATLDDAVDKLSKIRFAYDGLREEIRASNPLVKRNEKELRWANGSNVSVGTSWRGGTAQILHSSELGRVSMEKPDAAREFRVGSLPAVHAGGWAVLESTAHGTAGEFHDFVRAAERAQQEKRPLSPLEFKLHFYGWWMKEEYRQPNNLVVLTQELKEYFAKLNASLRALGHEAIDANQMAWYAIKYAEFGPDDMRQEYPSLMSELFFNSMQGAYWRRELNKARAEQRIGLPLPHDPSRKVNTWWDIGEDGTAIIFHQSDGVRHRFIDYYEEEGSSIQRCATLLDEKRRERGFMYGQHIGPHDLENRDWGNDAQTRKKTALDLGIKFEVVPRVEVKADSIEAARRLLGVSFFDSVHCTLLVERLENYRKRWNKALGVFSADPVHDAASHPADAYQQGAMFQKPDRLSAEDRGRHRPPPKRGSAWGA